MQYRLLPLIAVVTCLLGSNRSSARGAEDQVHLKVMAASVAVRSGPGGSYEEIGRVGKDQTYTSIDRSPDGAWYRIRLARGVTGWVLSELVWPYQIATETGPTKVGWLRRKVIDDSRLADSSLVLSLAAGALDRNGMFTLRLGFQPSQHYILEALVGLSSGNQGALLFYGAEVLIAINPWRSLVPFAAVGGGGATSLPHKESKLFEARTLPLLSAGGGLLLAMRGGFSLRVDVRRMLIFSNSDSWGMLTAVGGLMLVY